MHSKRPIRKSPLIALRMYLRERQLRLKRIHSDESGSISIASVFALLMLVFILGMVMNSTRQVDRKVKMQNAADAATRAGSLEITRSMNSLAFTNHLLADVFALTAFFREARDQNAAEATVEILDHWRRVGPELANSEFPPFSQLGQGINQKVPLEEQLVVSYSTWAYTAAMQMLPVFEAILAEQMIPEFQRALVLNTPRLAQYAADQVARRHGESWPVPVELRAVLWRTVGDPVGGFGEEIRRTLPVVDPVLDFEPNQRSYFSNAVNQRKSLAHRYLDEWNNESMRFFDASAKMSQFSSLWRTFTCGQLDRLLDEEYPNSNLPMQIRRFDNGFGLVRNSFTDFDHDGSIDLTTGIGRETLEMDYMFVGVVYTDRIPDRIPRMFANPVETTSTAYAQAQFFTPMRRLVLPTVNFIDEPFVSGIRNSRHDGGIPGNFINDPPAHQPRTLLNADRYLYHWIPEWVAHRQSGAAYPTRWNLLTQNWETQLVPATCDALPIILSRSPDINEVDDVELTDISSLTQDDLRWLNHH